ncbi:uncharacterized protein C3orf38 homolog isoform X2 [Patiria miniata]|uniref:Uncharacterized protein n=1 Tax=Patiria miniata TaxID=46514 RepID=A0A914AV03_PATMI|nr:uncharacterized protein C3orf38 homolog isoform X2 [Patiria miniata]
MLSEKEREGSAKFLQDFQKHELLSLVETVTNRMVAVQNKQEAIDAIILHSESALELLRRRRVKKEYLFRHLVNEKVSASPSADKATLISKLLSHWGTDISGLRIEEDDWRESPAKDRTPSPDLTSERKPRNAQVLAEQFAAWFFNQLNMLGRAMASDTPSVWGPHHFWEDCKLRLCITTSEQRDERFFGAECVSQRFQSFVRDEGLIFNPNISHEGTQGLDDPHGLVMVRVCGTVHRFNECLGLFEQQFGLIRDPLKENNWKIKFIEMKMKQATVERIPTLPAATDTTLAVK